MVVHFSVSNGSVTYDFVNSIALRKAKIVYNFGLSECNRVKRLNYWALIHICR